MFRILRYVPKAAFTLGAGARCPRMVLAGHKCEHIQLQLPTPEFRHCITARLQRRHLVLGHKSGHRVPVCTLFLLVLWQFTALYSLLSSCFKMASGRAKKRTVGNSYMSTQRLNATTFRAGTQSLVPWRQVWTASLSESALNRRNHDISSPHCSMVCE